MMAVLPSSRISAPMRRISSMCMKRFSKIVSMMVPTPLATVLSAANCACMSVGKAGYGAVRMSTAVGLLSAHIDFDPGVAHADFGAGLLQLADDRIQMLRPGILHPDMAAGDGARDQVGAGLDSIGQHFIGRAVETLHPFDDDPVGSGALDLGAHGVKKFARSTTSGSRAAFSSTVSPSANVAAIMRFSVPVTVTVSSTRRAPLRRSGAGLDVAVLDMNVGAHGLQARDVDVDRTRADRAARREATRRHGRSAPAAGPAPESTRAWSSPADRARNIP